MAALCEQVLEFSEKATSHDVATASGNVRFMRPCGLVAGHHCVDCDLAVCEHHRWARHDGHRVREVTT